MTGAFKKGEIVQLKSGGPKMTVDEVSPFEVECVWFAGAKRESAMFSTETLMSVPDDAKTK